ncbi:MAG: class I tRNA ligase family protein, partial [Candidatus Nanohaloarchaeota archaeon QJJ-5]|nr:class I tRNA ligase family protein [Candidatus Nanohaloarchaeota archaeon QJJ-5]
YWGTPITIWVCNDCGNMTIVGSFEELEDHVGDLPADFDPHKHTVDGMTWDCDCGGTYERIPDILDVWFDSGCAPFASVHYPFEEEPLESMWPMDFITEASDQIRGWFYSLLFCGILGFDEAPYNTVLFQGHVLDADGQKMSKSVGNVIDPQEQIEDYGADLPRFYSLRVASPWEQTKYDEDEIEQEVYRLFSVFWNTKEFFETHGELKERPSDDAFEPEDRWLLSRTNSLIETAHETMEDQYFHETARALEDFILDDLSRWYLKKVRSRVKDGDRAATWTLRHALMQTTKLMAPFAPYISEKIYQDLEGEQFSVHAAAYPDPALEWIDADLEAGMDLAREIVEQAIKIRDENEYNLRWPARRIVIATDTETQERLEPLETLITSMANVDTVEFGDVATELVAEPHYPSLGPKFGSDAETVASRIEELDHDEVEQLKSVGEIVIDDYDVALDDVEIKNTTAESMGNKEFEHGQLYLDLHMTDDIEQRAFVNEVVRAIQQHRKEAGLEMDDQVKVTLNGDTDPVKDHETIITDRVNVATIEYNGEARSYSGTVSFKEFELDYSFSDPVA